MIFHITNKKEWEHAQGARSYFAQSLQTEGFIHCSTKSQICKVANSFYNGQADLILLCIEPDALQPSLKWEAPAHIDPDNPPPTADDELFPHIYGEINLEGVQKVVDFPANADGTFSLPEEIKNME